VVVVRVQVSALELQPFEMALAFEREAAAAVAVGVVGPLEVDKWLSVGAALVVVETVVDEVDIAQVLDAAVA
jgi:hypothetical protein